jgi:hypothetical protein
MSLERQSREPNSTLCQFLDRWLPQRRDIVDSWREQVLSVVQTPTSLRCDRAVVGKALDARIGLDLAKQPGCVNLLGFLPPEACRSVLTSCGFSVRDLADLPDTQTTDPVLQAWTRTAHPHVVDDDELAVLTYLLDLMGMEQVSHRFEGRRPVQLCRGLFLAMFEGCAPRPADDPELLVLCQDWERYLEQGRALMQALGDRVIVSPVLVPGFAIADLVVGLTLVEIKNYQDPAPYLQSWLDQVLGYVLLDRWNTLHLTHVAVYCPGHACLLVEPIEEVLRVSAPSTSPRLGQLRVSFQEAMYADLQDAAQWRHRRLFPMPPGGLTPPPKP